MQLTDSQKQTVRGWISEGLKLADVQRRLDKDFGIVVTYMEVRFLVDDLKVIPKDPEPAPAPPTPPEASSGGVMADSKSGSESAPGAAGKVSITVDTVTRPGTMVSGSVKFGDGEKGTWYIDQMGRPGLAPETKGYRPSQPDIMEFQVALDRELSKLGM